MKERQLGNSGMWHSCKPAAAGGQKWNPALESYRPFEDPSWPDSSLFTVDDTESILFGLALAVEQRDHQTAGHCERLAFLSVALGSAMGLDQNDLVALHRGGYLHDIGKVGIPDSILLKPGSLTPDEWVVMRSHPTRGEEICRPMKSLLPVLSIIRNHHERWDGSGYPDGLRGDQIPLLARVLQIADIYDALTSARTYKPAYAPEQALAIIEEETAKGWRDPEIVRIFREVHHDAFTRGRNMSESLMRLNESLRTGPPAA